MIQGIKEKLVWATGGISGAASIIGSWQVCHNLCLGIIALLGIMGIVVTGMPLIFLTTITVPMWTIAVLLLLAAILMHINKKCISRSMLVINSGLIIAGIPFQSLQKFTSIFWIIGGLFVVSGIIIYFVDRTKKKKC